MNYEPSTIGMLNTSNITAASGPTQSPTYLGRKDAAKLSVSYCFSRKINEERNEKRAALETLSVGLHEDKPLRGVVYVFGFRNNNSGSGIGRTKACTRSLMKKEGLDPTSKYKKRPYSPPTATKLTLEQAKRFVAEHSDCTDQEAVGLLESLRREQQQKDN